MPRDRTPPHAVEAEVSTLGAIMVGGTEAMGDVVGKLDPDHFYRENHRHIYRAMMALYSRGETVDPTSVGEELRQAGALEKAGGFPYLAELLDAVPTAASLAYHAKIVTDRARRRKLIEAGQSMVVDAFDSPDDTDTVIDRAERAVMEVSDTRTRKEPVFITEAMTETFAGIEARQNAPGGITGIPTGYHDLDHLTGGFQKSDLVIIAARPSTGKTAFVTSMLLHAAIERKETVAMFSLEMSKEQLVQRMLCSEGIVDLGRLLRGRLVDDDYVRLGHASGVIHKAPIWIDDSGDLSVLEIRAKARRLASKGALGMVVVDYLQLMRGGAKENRTQEVSEISRGLKLLAKELHVPVIALSQLSRAPEQRTNHRPVLSDLRESGSIEQDADVVMFLYRPEMYLTEVEAREQNVAGRAECIIAKQRNGPTDTAHLHFRKECARFESLTMQERAA